MWIVNITSASLNWILYTTGIHNLDSDVTFQLSEPAQVVETCTGDPVNVMFKCEFTVQQNPVVTDNITPLNVHRVDGKSAISIR